MATDRAIREAEQNLIKEIETMKFSFKKLVKVVTLEAMLNYFNK